MRILITGICGFVGGTLARGLRDGWPDWEIVSLDNLVRAGSETNRRALRKRGIRLYHGDVRNPSDLESLARCDWIIEAAANPSVLAGVDGKTSSRQLIEHNLVGTINTLELFKQWRCGFTILSTSRVYSIRALAAIPVKAQRDRFVPRPTQHAPRNTHHEPRVPGFSPAGIAEEFSTEPPLSLYGSSKRASELLACEYAECFDLPVSVLRCGVLSGAGQFGKIDQGIFSYWIHAWSRKRPLKYIGFKGSGFQVRDCLHARDLLPLVARQIKKPRPDAPRVLNVSGGLGQSASLRQLSAWCADRFGPRTVKSEAKDRPFDVPARPRFNPGRAIVGLEATNPAGSHLDRDRRARREEPGLAGRHRRLTRDPALVRPAWQNPARSQNDKDASGFLVRTSSFLLYDIAIDKECLFCIIPKYLVPSRPPEEKFSMKPFMISRSRILNPGVLLGTIISATVVLTASADLTSCAPPPSGLVSWWRAEGGARDNADSNHGILLNGASPAPGMVGPAFSFSGNNQCVQIPYAPSLVTSNYSIEAWVKPLAQVSDFISQDLIFGQSFGHCQLLARTGGTGVRVAFAFGTSHFTFFEVAGTGELPIGQFSHLAGTWDGTTLRLYINGALNAQSTPGASPVDSGCPFFIGGFYSPAADTCNYVGQFFDGLIDEVSYFKRALTAAEIQAIYIAGGAGKCGPAVPPSTNCVPAPAGLVDWWRGEGNALDQLGRNNGVLLNGVGFDAGVAGQAFRFNGSSNSYVQVADSPTLRFTNALTIECWAKRLNTSEVHVLLEKGGDWTGGQTDFEIALNDTYFGGSHFGFAFAGGWRGCAVTPDTAWHHYAVVAVSGQANPILYIDGVPQPITDSGGPATMSLFASTRPLHIGAQLDPQTGWFYYSSTMIDEPAIYGRVLSASEIQAIYNAGSAGKCPLGVAPSIVTQPLSQTVLAGSNATFTVTAAGTPPLSYQWRLNGTNITGATTTSLTLINVQPAQAGNYTMRVTNAFGSITSSNALLTVINPTPVCLTPPAGLVGWWRAEGNGNDNAGTNNAYALPNVHFTSGVVGQAFACDPENYTYGTYVGVRIADQPAYALTNSLTVEGWIRPRGVGYVVLSRGDNRSGFDPYVLSMQRNNLLAFAVTDASGTAVGVSAPLLYNQWWHVAGTLDGASGKLSLYTNGSLAAQITTTIRPFGNLIPQASPGLGIGNVNDGFNNFPFLGDIDEVSLYNRALAGAEIAAIYNADGAGKCPLNHIPVAVCADAVVAAGADCRADASVNNGSFDPDGDPITVSQVPPGPYPLGTNRLTLSVSDNHGASNSCSAFVIVQDRTPPVIICASNKVVQCGTAWSFDPPFAFDNCSATNVFITEVSTVTNAGCGRTFTATRLWIATDTSGNTNACRQTIFVQDTTPPVLSGCPTNGGRYSLLCAVPPPEQVTAVDNCQTNVTVVFTETQSNPGGSSSNEITRTWTATDTCGNSSAGGQVILVDNSTPSPDIYDYVLFAYSKLSFGGGQLAGRGYIDGGNVGVNLADSNPLDSSPGANVGANARFVMADGTQLVADSMRFDEEASAWNVFRNYTVANFAGQIRGSLGTFTPPIIPAANLPGLGFTPGRPETATASDVVVADGPVTLPAGTYRDITVNDGKVLTLVAGTYNVRNFHTGKNTLINVTDGTVLQIDGKFNVGDGGSFGTNTTGMAQVRAGSLGVTGLTEATINFGRNVQAKGQFFAPFGLLDLGHTTDLVGRFWADRIGSDWNVNVSFNCERPVNGLGPAAPPQVRLNIKVVNGQIELTWPLGTLQEADDAHGTYTDVPAATSPHTVSPGAARKAYRVRVQ